MSAQPRAVRAGWRVQNDSWRRRPGCANGRSSRAVCHADAASTSVYGGKSLREPRFTVREFRDSDFQSIVDVQTQSFYEPSSILDGALREFKKGLFRAEVVDSLKSKIRSPKGICVLFVAVPAESGSDGQPVGIVELFLGQDTSVLQKIESLGVGPRVSQYAWVSSMAVNEQYRNQGCAKALLDAIHSRMFSFRCTWSALAVFPNNMAAIELYKQAGYVEVGTRGPTLLKFLGGKPSLLMLRPRDDVKDF